MGKNLLVGVNGTARKAKKIYLGIDGKARKVKKIYLGVDGKARLVYSGDELITGIELVSYSWIRDNSAYKTYNGYQCPTYICQMAFKVTPSTAQNIRVNVTSLLHNYSVSYTDEDDDGNDVTTALYGDECIDFSSSYTISSDGYVYVRLIFNSTYETHSFEIGRLNEYKPIVTIDICNTVDGITKGVKFDYNVWMDTYGVTIRNMNYSVTGSPYALG